VNVGKVIRISVLTSVQITQLFGLKRNKFPVTNPLIFLIYKKK
jgi:hypothetical protein